MIVFYQENLELDPDGRVVFGTTNESVNGKHSNVVHVEGLRYTDLSKKEYSIDCFFISSTTLFLQIKEGECDNALEIFSHVATYIGKNWYYYKKKWYRPRKKVYMKIMFMLPITNTNKVLVSLANWKERPTIFVGLLFLSRSIKNQLIFSG